MSNLECNAKKNIFELPFIATWLLSHHSVLCRFEAARQRCDPETHSFVERQGLVRSTLAP